MEILNDILGYKDLMLYQDTDYFCFSLDSIVLANYCNIRLSDKNIVEFCSGNGVVSFILSKRTTSNIIGIEIQKPLFDLSIKSLNYNKLNDRITFINDDIKNYVSDKSNFVDLILCNPPYFKYNKKSKLNESPEKIIARHEVSLNLDELCSCAKRILKDNGKLCLVHRCDRFSDVLDSFMKYNIVPKRIKFVYNDFNSESNLFLIEGLKNAKSGLSIDKPLILYNLDGSETDEYNKLKLEVLK